jgi:hypothetical protein
MEYDKTSILSTFNKEEKRAMEEKILGTIVVGLVGTLLTFSRRYKNTEESAGIGTAGWSIFIILLMN